MKVDRRFSQVVRTIWSHPKFRKLSKPKPNAQTLVLRLLVAPEMTGVPGIFKAWDAALAADLGWPLSAFRKCLTEVIEAGWAVYDEETGVFWLPNALEQEANQPANPNVVRSWRTPLAELPESKLKTLAIEKLVTWAKDKGDSWSIALEEALGKRSAMSSPNPSGKSGPKALVEGSPKQEHEHEHEKEQEHDPPKPPEGDDGDDSASRLIACPKDLALPEQIIEGLMGTCGATREQVLAEVQEFKSYWTIGGGMGRTFSRGMWLRKCRERIRQRLSEANSGRPASNTARQIAPLDGPGPADPAIAERNRRALEAHERRVQAELDAEVAS